MASLWKHPKSSFWMACFTIHSPTGSVRWKRSVKTADRKLARRIADALEEAGCGAMDERAIASFGEKVLDPRARRAAGKAFADVFRVVAGREIGAGSLRAFADSWLADIRSEISPLSFLRYKQVVEEFVAFIGRAAERDLVGFGNRDDTLVIQFRDQLAAPARSGIREHGAEDR